MQVKHWNLPISAKWKRATELESLTRDLEGLTLLLLEQGGERRWRLRFNEVQAFKVTTEESFSPRLLEALPDDGSFFEVVASEWMNELGRGVVEYMSRAHHYVICCYDEVIEVVSSKYVLEPI